MNCETVNMNISELASQAFSVDERMQLENHIKVCPDCQDAFRGAEALIEIRQQQIEEPSQQLFDNIMTAVTSSAAAAPARQRFWFGAGFGGAIAASLFTLALFFGWTGSTDSQRPGSAGTAEFVVAIDETRQMNLAFETDRILAGARITILLTGNVEVEGYGRQRELSWSENLDAGVNRLSLPVLASGIGGGQMVVHMTHPLSEQVFVINLPTES